MAFSYLTFNESTMLSTCSYGRQYVHIPLSLLDRRSGIKVVLTLHLELPSSRRVNFQI